MTDQTKSNRRPVRSFVIRSGRLTESQRRAIGSYWNDYVIPYTPSEIEWSEHFPSKQALTLEIGFGMGDSLLKMACEQPSQNFIGIEVHRAGVGKLINGIRKHELTNIKLICHDAVEVLQHCVAAESIDRILVFFPDPWHKKRHNKRRIIQAPFVSLLASRLRPSGRVHLATDWQPYAEHMLEVLESETAMKNANGENTYWEEPDRPDTKFEQRGKRLGHGVWDLLYVKN